MLNFTQTGYHKSAEAAAFGRIFGRGKIIILEAGVRCGASLDSLYMETQWKRLSLLSHDVLCEITFWGDSN